jgi:inhibitor of cysteine peptidase
MRNIFILLILTIFSFVSTYASDLEDTSILDELEKQEVKQLDFDFNLKSFETCENMEDVMWKYIKSYWENNKNNWNYPVLYRSMWAVDMVMEESAVMEKSITSDSVESSKSIGWWSDDFSKTNSQVDWVDESDIVKTDWKYIYYYNETDKFVYIVESWNLKVVKKIKLPSNFNRPVLYIWKNRLTILSSGYSNTNYSKMGYWINRNAKTYTIVFDTTDIEKPVLSKLYVADWDLRKSRKIGDNIYIISNNSFNVPFRDFKEEDDIVIQASKMMPKKIDISLTSDKSKQNLKLRGKDLPYNITAWNVANCNEIEYVLPDEETIKKFDFNPAYNIISIIDTKDLENEVKTKVIAGSNSEIYMSLDNLYLTSHMYQSNNFSCPINARCFAPWYPRGQNTLVHKINLNNTDLKYQTSTIIPGSPLTQYSMDEYKGDFRILTSTNTWWEKREQHTDLYILDKDLELKWSLKNLWEGENFKSSRYIGDKLYLVTFKQIDPFFVIDVSDSSDPKVLGELKIPGYSTYLHPYDENHLIGLWYDTTENKWGGTMNNGLKIDLYDVSDFENPKQKYSYTLGEYGSYSEALTNPRMFMWKASENKLFLPATLYKNDADDKYRHTDFFQWLVTMTIDKNSGIKEDFRITHINYDGIKEERKKECSKYSSVDNAVVPKCYKLIDGWEYCEPVKRNYVPKYCYAESSIWEYISSRSWNFRESFIKRALWIGNNTFSLSDDKIKSSNISTGINTGSVSIGE